MIAETAVSRLTERGATRADDRISEAGMEDRKREGYFDGPSEATGMHQ